MVVILIACGNDSTNTESASPSDEENQDNDKVVLSFGHSVSENNIYQTAALKFKEKVDEYSNGSVEIEVYPGGQLGSSKAMLEGVQNGSIDGVYSSLAYFENLTPVLTGLQMPFLIEDFNIEEKVATSDLAKDALEELEEYNLKGFEIVPTGFRYIGNNERPINSTEDLGDLKLRASEGGIQMEMYEALGASPTPMAFDEVYTSMQTGALNGLDMYLDSYITDNFGEGTDYINETPVNTWPAVITLGLEKFNSLSEDQQKAIEKAAKETQGFMFEEAEKIEVKAKEELQDMGIEFTPSMDMDELRESMEPIYDEYAEKHPIVEEMIEYIYEISDFN